MKKEKKPHQHIEDIFNESKIPTHILKGEYLQIATGVSKGKITSISIQRENRNGEFIQVAKLSAKTAIKFSVMLQSAVRKILIQNEKLDSGGIK